MIKQVSHLNGDDDDEEDDGGCVSMVIHWMKTSP